jgi:hypothetical protein
MSDLRQAAQQALEALEKTHTQPGCEQWQAERKASVALRHALAQHSATDQFEDALDMVARGETVNDSLTVDCPTCGGGQR